jgi:hypothetical protein
MGVPGNANALLLKQAAAAAGGYQISRSVRFNSSDSAYLSRVFSNASASTWTFSAWMKRGALGSAQKVFGDATDGSTGDSGLWLDSDDTLFLSDGQVSPYKTAAVFRDCSAWYHVVATVSSGTTLKIYVNGADQTASGSPNIIRVNSNRTHGIGFNKPTSPSYFNGLLADIHFIDGQALDPSSFGEFDTNGVWQPIAYSGSYGTNGFHLPFSDNSTAAALGTDTSSNGNTWTVNNISVTAGAANDSLVDSPTNYGTDTGAGGEVRGNYCTWNPLKKVSGATAVNGNLAFTVPTDGGIASTFAISSGKWYWEVVLSSGRTILGLATTSWDPAVYPGYTAQGWGYSAFNGNKIHNASSTSYGASFTTGDVIGVAFDADAGTLTFYTNGASQGQAFSGITGAVYQPALGADGGTTGAGDANFGQRPFAHPLSGFEALCTTNLPEPTIADGSQYFQVIKYTGNGTTQTLPNINSEPSSGLNFEPSLVWIKSRSGADNHAIQDAVRGATYVLQSNTTNAEVNAANTVGSFTSDGFTLAGGAGSTNGSSVTYAAWCWDAGGTTDPSNEAGSRTSQVRANASAGFSVVTYTGNAIGGATVGHGLGVEPHLIICKSRSGSTGWLVYHKSLGNTNYLILDATDASAAAAAAWNNTTPTSTVFTIGTGSFVNTNGATQVSYCFAPVAGYSSFGSYTGNGSADGPFVFCNFRPRWVLVKMSSGTSSWQLLDSARSDYNVMDDALFPNLNNAETVASAYNTDFLSNGFKIRDADSFRNGSGSTFIYAAFAEHPFATARAR